jgi:Spy/CpxP family protein refolding chaperone
MAFNSDRLRAGAIVALVFVLGVAFGVAGVLVSRRVTGVAASGTNAQGGQINQLVRTLKLTPGQEAQFRETLADTRAQYDAIRRETDPQMEQVRKQNRDRIREILTPEQRSEFENFLTQARNRRNQQNGQNGRRNDGGAPGTLPSNWGRTLTVGRLTQELHLTAEQQTQLGGILRDTRASFDSLRQQINPQFEEARLQNRDRLRQIVSPEQRQGLEDFFQRRDEERRRR